MVKINGIKVITNGKFAYNGCHKIYIIEDKEDEQKAIEYGYSILPISKLKITYDKSCSLKFINNWKLNKTYVGQFEEALFEVKN